MISKVAVAVEPSGLRPGVIQSAIFQTRGHDAKYSYERRLVLQPIQRTRLILHVGHLRTGSHKLELAGGDSMTLKEIFRTISVVSSAEIDQLRVMRIDTSADVVGRSVHWFRDHIRVPHKHCHDVYSSVTSRSRGFQPETMYYGRGNDVLRIYDKAEELRHRRKFNCPRFTRWPSSNMPSHLVRIERQFRGKAVPDEFKRLGGLLNAHLVNPFRNVTLYPVRALDYGEAPIRTVLASQALARDIRKHGQQAMIRQFNKWSKGNGLRITRLLSKLTNLPDKIDLYAIFRDEVLAQLEVTQ